MVSVIANTNNSIHYLSFVCWQKWLQVLLFNSNKVANFNLLTTDTSSLFLTSPVVHQICFWELMHDSNYTRMLRAILNKSWRQHPTKQQLYCHLPPITKLDEPDMRNSAGEVGTNLWETYSCGPPHIGVQRQDNQREPTYNSSVPIQDVSLKSYCKWWTVEKGGGRGSGRSVLMGQHDDDDDDDDGDRYIFLTMVLMQLSLIIIPKKMFC